MPLGDISQRGAYEYFRGLDGERARWTRDLGQRAPTFEYPAHVNAGDVVYNPGLGRYLLVTCSGDFAANGSRTVAAPLAKVFKAVEDPAERRRWCPDAPLEVTSVTPGKYVRAKWSGSEGRVAFYFEKQDSGKSRVAVDHMGLPDEKEAVRMKAWWGERLDRLRGNIEGKAAKPGKSART